MSQLNVTVYSTSSCAICHALMQWFDKRGVAYREVIVDEQEQGMTELITVSGGAIGVPYTVIENENGVAKISGFDRGAIERALI